MSDYGDIHRGLYPLGTPQREPWRRARQFITRLLGALAILFMAVFIVFAVTLRTTPDLYEKADAIVVLTGGAPERISTSLNLLQDGKGQRLLVSGVHEEYSFADILALGTPPNAGLSCCIDLDYSARNTIGNAAQAANWVEIYDYHSLIIVTSAHHMPRALLELRRAMPNVAFSPHPVVPPRVRFDAWWRYPGTFNLLMGEYVRYLWSLANLPGRD